MSEHGVLWVFPHIAPRIIKILYPPKPKKISFKALKNQETSILNEVKNHAAAYNEIIATSSEKNIGLEDLRAEINKLI